MLFCNAVNSSVQDFGEKQIEDLKFLLRILKGSEAHHAAVGLQLKKSIHSIHHVMHFENHKKGHIGSRTSHTK